MKLVDAAWLAAAIDGEGTIGVYRGAPKICIANNSKKFLENAMRICCGAGGISVHRRYEGKITYTYNLARIDAVLRVLVDVEPFLIIKRENARRVIRWLKNGRTTSIKLTHSDKRWGPKRRVKSGSRGSGNWGNSEKHRANSLKHKNNHLKGWHGDRDRHRFAKLNGFA